LKVPMLISSMTGGAPRAEEINRNLATAAQELGLAMGVGSQRAALQHPELASTYQVRALAPDIPLFANIGAVQLNYAYGVDECRRAVDMIGADALILHLNALQEAVQPEGDTNFAGLVGKIAQVCREVGVPVIAKEVGWGISAEAARMLWEAGVSAIDVAGAGGTSWSQVELHRIPTERGRLVAEAFADWGIPTVTSLLSVRQAGVPEGKRLFASGGVRNGIDVSKGLSLGADVTGMGQLHVGLEDSFTPARKAHPALLVQNLAALRASLVAAGMHISEAEPIPGTNRFYVHDPFGNRLELIEGS